MSPDIRDAMSHVKENDKWAYDLINYKLQTLQARCDKYDEIIKFMFDNGGFYPEAVDYVDKLLAELKE